MEQYSGREWPLGEKQLKGIRVWKIMVESIAGKQSSQDWSLGIPSPK
jgi:hypothetical protein